MKVLERSLCFCNWLCFLHMSNILVLCNLGWCLVVRSSFFSRCCYCLSQKVFSIVFFLLGIGSLDRGNFLHWFSNMLWLNLSSLGGNNCLSLRLVVFSFEDILLLRLTSFTCFAGLTDLLGFFWLTGFLGLSRLTNFPFSLLLFKLLRVIWSLLDLS